MMSHADRLPPLVRRAVEVTPWTDTASQASCRYNTYFGELAQSCGVKHVRVAAEGASSSCGSGFGTLGVNADALAKVVAEHLGI